MTPRWITAPFRWVAEYRDELAIVGLALLYQGFASGALLPRAARVEERAVTVRVMAPVAVAVPRVEHVAVVAAAAPARHQAHAAKGAAAARLAAERARIAAERARAAARQAELARRLGASGTVVISGLPTQAELAALRRLDVDSTLRAARVEARVRDAVARAMVLEQHAMPGAHVYGAYTSTGS